MKNFSSGQSLYPPPILSSTMEANIPAVSLVVISTPCIRMAFKHSRFPFDATTWKLNKKKTFVMPWKLPNVTPNVILYLTDTHTHVLKAGAPIYLIQECIPYD